MKRCVASVVALTISACTSSPAFKPRVTDIVPSTASADVRSSIAASQSVALPSRSDFASSQQRSLDGMIPPTGFNPFDPVALNNQAVTESERGNYNEASNLLERAFRLSPDNAVIAANLSKLREFKNSIGPLKIGAANAENPITVPTPPPEPPPLWQPAAGTSS